MRRSSSSSDCSWRTDVASHASWADYGVPKTRAEAMLAAAEGREVRRPLVFECVGAPGLVQSLAEDSPVGTRIVVVGVCMQTDHIDGALDLLNRRLISEQRGLPAAAR